MLSGFDIYPRWVPLNQYGFMTHHRKACEQNKLKMPACKLYLVPGPRKTAFFSAPLETASTPRALCALIWPPSWNFFSQILMKHLGGGLARTWYILINRALLLNWHWKMNYYTSMPFKLYERFFYSLFMRYLHIERLEFTHVVVSHSNLLRKKKAFTPT